MRKMNKDSKMVIARFMLPLHAMTGCCAELLHTGDKFLLCLLIS